MNLKLLFLSILFLPLSIDAMSVEEEAAGLLGQSYKSEAAQSFFKTHQLVAEFPDRGIFTINFYAQGVSIKINGGEFIQAIQVYNETMLFKTFSEKVYGKKLSEVYDLNDIYRVIKMAPIAENEASGTFIYPNKKPADYLIRVIRKKDNTMRTIAWMMDDIAMEKIIAEATKPMHDTGINSHEEVWALLGTKFDTESRNKFIEGHSLLLMKSTAIRYFIKTMVYTCVEDIYINRGREIIGFIEFKRRGQFGTKVSFPHALPERALLVVITR